MNELSPRQVSLHDTFWTPRLQVNAERAIFHQWQMLEDSLCIDNFRIAAGEKEGFREGWFFADSDAYKWLDAAARTYALWPSDTLKTRMDDFIGLLGRTQMEDGYIFTYNQVHFPAERWDNLMIEHELYCHGHLIEAGVSHYEATGEKSALDIARRAADLLVRDFLVAAPDRTSGHEEIEIALMRLYKVTRHGHYLELARQFLERRGKVRPFAALIFRQNTSVNWRAQFVNERRKAYQAEHPEHTSFQLPPDNFAKKTRTAKIRWQLSGLTGKYFQMHAPIRKQTVPVGHAVRFAYLETAIAMLYRQDADQTLLPALQKAWERMVTRRMYVTGGIGSLPALEGFGNDYELDPEIAYAETCAALGSLFWNWEMALITGEARYSDLFEWQLYNAAAVGMGLGGDTYLYNNPLACRGGVTRRAWFLVPCCPSNLSRTWASLGKYVFSSEDNELWIHQYIGCQTEINLGTPVKIDLQSGLPWDGKVRIVLDPETATDFTIHLRIPSWTERFVIHINGQTNPIQFHSPTVSKEMPASGYDPRQAWFLPVRRVWSPGDVLEVELEMQVTLRRASPRLHGHKNKVTLTRGPLVYCLESVDNPGVDIFSSRLNPSSVVDHASSVTSLPALLGGTKVITGKTTDGKNLTFIPYLLWANRGESQMTVWVNS
ncbi:MAG: glycoside hydrolase family 127 protein [Chloroflexi bacterium]|nr:glycoside hydrolase family 127 protein [Chloroflexota bacterium]